MSSHERPGYKIVGSATWELIRAAYLAGESAPALAERFGVSEHAIRKRATKEHWTKRDYAAALEARGLEPPPKPAPLNVAERFAANYQPPPPPPEPQHPFADLVEALKAASSAAEAGRARPSVSDDPAALEKQALAQMSEALARGRAGDAKALGALAEQMRKRAESEREAAEAEEEAVRLLEEDRTAAMMEIFGKAAYLAHAMLHHPTSGPAMLMRLIKRWREINLGEGERDAEARAAKVAESYRHYLDGSWVETTPEDVREYLARRWEEQRLRLDGEMG